MDREEQAEEQDAGQEHTLLKPDCGRYIVPAAGVFAGNGFSLRAVSPQVPDRLGLHSGRIKKTR